MSYYSTRQIFFIDSLAINQNKVKEIDRFLSLLSKSGVCDLIKRQIRTNYGLGGRPTYDPYNLLAAILYCFALNKGSLREIEEMCNYDVRVIYIMMNNYPSHMTISNFINDYILPNQYAIFSLIVKQIFKECKLCFDDVYIDGSKFEANANKYKFVWKPTKFHEKLSNRIYDLLGKYKMTRGIEKGKVISSIDVASKVTEFNEYIKNQDVTGKELKVLIKDYNLLNEFLNKSLEYEEKERLCGQNRNSYYKTDVDATAMCLKEDYYSGIGSNMHAAYNVQIAVSNGLITTYLITQSRSDMNDFIETIDSFYNNYGFYPKNICADAGYGNFDNYEYLFKHNIGNYVKHQSWEGNVSGRYPSQYHINDDQTIICLNNKIGTVDNNPIRHPKKANAVLYKIEGCNSCNFSTYCKRYMKVKDENYKIFEVIPKLQDYIKKSEINLLSIKGIELRVNRSAQVEGAFGCIKQNMKYERFRRRSIDKVSTEFMLIALGYNLRKYFKFIDGKGKFKYWAAPKDIKPESFKKPSAKRLANRVNRKTSKLNK